MFIQIEYPYDGKTYTRLINTDEADRDYCDEDYMCWIDTELNHEINLLKDVDEFDEYFIDKNDIKVYVAVFEDIIDDAMPIDIVAGEDVKCTLIDERDGIAFDVNGKEIKNGDKVKWTDPETKAIVEYEVYDNPTCEMVKLWSEFGECEALPFECEII